MRPILLFDVNETLLDLRALDTLFEEKLGSAALRPLWFAQMLQLSFVGGLIDRYVNFTDAQLAALDMIAERANVDISRIDRDAIVDAMSDLPPHPEVPEALDRLQANGFRMATLTNSVGSVAATQVRNAGIAHVFEKVLSADEVTQLKPAPAPYLMAAESFGVSIGETCLIAAHAWDISGALAAGCAAAFVSRPGAVLSPVGPRPEIIGRDMSEIADLLLAAAARDSAIGS
jgi:2-haloacid dehalogenase